MSQLMIQLMSFSCDPARAVNELANEPATTLVDYF